MLDNQNNWLVYALLAAGCAAVVNIFAKIGMQGIDSTLATAVRSVVMVLFLAAVCTAQSKWAGLGAIDRRAMGMIALSGVAGAASWLFAFKALAVGGDVTRVSPIDKLSVPLAAVLAFLILKERPGAINWVGLALIVAGGYLAALKDAPWR